MQEDYVEIDLREIIHLLWDNKVLIISIFLIAVMGSAIFSQYFLDEVYQASATLYAPSFTLLNGEKLSNSEYINFFNRQSILEDLIEEYNLRDRNPDISYESLRSKLDISRDNNILQLKLKDSSPELARDMLISWYSLTIDEVKAYINQKNDRYLMNIENSLEKNEEEYLLSVEVLDDFQEESNLDFLLSEQQAKQERFVSLNDRIGDTEIRLGQLQPELKVVQRQLEESERYLTLNEPINDSFLNNNAEDSLFTGDREIINPQYELLEGRRNEIEQDLSSSEIELTLLENQYSNLDEEIDALQKDIANKENQKRILESNYESNRRKYESVEEHYNSSIQELANYDYDISVLNEPFTPRTRISPNKKLNVAIAGVLGLMLAIFYVFFREYMKDEENVSEKGKYHEA